MPRSITEAERCEPAAEGKVRLGSCDRTGLGEGRELITEIDGEETNKSEKAKADLSLAERCGREHASGCSSSLGGGRKMSDERWLSASVEMDTPQSKHTFSGNRAVASFEPRV